MGWVTGGSYAHARVLVCGMPTSYICRVIRDASTAALPPRAAAPIVAEAGVLSVVQADTAALPALVLYVLTAVGIFCLAVVQRRALLRAPAAGREAAAKAERLERERA